MTVRSGSYLAEKPDLKAFYPGAPILFRGERMLSTIPVDLKKVRKEELDKEILRVGMIAELDAVSLYEQLAALTDSSDIKAVFLDIAKEEKTHMGEFEELLLRLDKQQSNEILEAKKEVRKLTGK